MKRLIPLAALAALLLPGAARATADWQPFRSEPGGFTVLLPGRPAEQTETIDDSPVHRFTLSPEPGRGFVIAYGDRQDFRSTPVEEVFDNVRNGFLSGSGGTLKTERTMALAGRPAREILAEGPNGSLLKARFILDGERLYTVVAVAPAGDSALEEMDRFLNSFMLLKP
jgi:hypothetical protein